MTLAVQKFNWPLLLAILISLAIWAIVAAVAIWVIAW